MCCCSAAPRRSSRSMLATASSPRSCGAIARVIVMDRTNIRNVTPADLPYAPELVVIDTSFISLRIVLPAVIALAAPNAEIIALVKPQFEVGKGKVGKGGVVRDDALRTGSARWHPRVRARGRPRGGGLHRIADSWRRRQHRIPRADAERFRLKRDYVVGLDMGGTNIRTAAVSRAGEVLLMLRAPARAEGSAVETVENIATQVLALQDAARSRGPRARARHRRRGAGSTQCAHGRRLCRAAREGVAKFSACGVIWSDVLERPVIVENDANAWTLGEYWRGAARGCKNVVLLTLGTGIGGGLIVDGKIVHGRSGMAAELGHVCVEADGMPCDCGSHGCLEAYASASGLCGLLKQRLGCRGIATPGEVSAIAAASSRRAGSPARRDAAIRSRSRCSNCRAATSASRSRRSSTPSIPRRS